MNETRIKKDVIVGAVLAVTRGSEPPSTVTYTYSDPNNPHYVASKTDERTNPTYYTRYPANHPHFPNAVQRIDYPDGGFETFDYNNFGQVVDHQMTSGGTEHFRYDGRGLKTSYWPPETSSDSTPDQNPTRYFYYESGRHTDRLHYMVDPHGNTTWYEYNLRGLVKKVTHQDGTFIQRFYNDDGTLERVVDELQHITRNEYDEYKRTTKVIQIVNGIEQVTINDYTPRPVNGVTFSPLSHTSASVYRVESPTHKVVEYDYDANFRRNQMKQAPGVQGEEAITTYHYDSVGNLDWADDPRLKRTTYGYDEFNRQTSVTNVELNETTATEYDPAGNKIKEIRPDTTLRGWDYDPMNRLFRAYDWHAATDDPQAFAPTTTYDRDHAGNIHTITDPKGAVYTYAYDELNRKSWVTYPIDANGAVGIETWLYDIAGNLELYTNPDGRLKHLHYDNRNRQDESWWDANVGPHIVTRYDSASRVTRILCTSAQVGMMAIVTPDEVSFETMVSYGYDEANRKIWEEQTLAGHPTRRVKTELNDDGTRHNLRVVNPDALFAVPYLWPTMDIGGTVVPQEVSSYSLTYAYTERNQLRTVSGEDWSFNYVYDASGNMTTRGGLYNGRSSSTNCPSLSYDALNRPTVWEQTSSSMGGAFARSHYQYDRANREEATWRDEEDSRGERFTYEPTNQLSGAVYRAHDVWTPNPTGAGRSVNYAYAINKLNRTSLTEQVGSTTTVTNYSNSALNQYGSVGGIGYTYDDNFNLTGAGALNATYDAANHLMSAIYHDSVLGTSEFQFVYDGLGRCVKRTNTGRSALFLYDDWKVISEFDDWDDCDAWNVYGPGADEILLRYQVQYGYIRFQLDRHGNVAFLLDNDGLVRERYSYDAFGQPAITDRFGHTQPYSFFGHCFLFQGREYIRWLGIYDYRNRFYAPATGRFLQTDPTGFGAGDMNLFRYCGDDPVDMSDPLGLEGEIFGEGQLEVAVDVARHQVEAANSDPGRKMVTARIQTKGGGSRSVQYYPSKMVPVMHLGKGYQVGATVDGVPRTTSGESFELETPAELGRRMAALVHGHNDVKGGKKGDRSGIAQAGWSVYDKKVRNIDRTDESNPGVWHSRRNWKEVPSDRASREKASRGAGGSSSSSAVSASSTDALSSRPSAAIIDSQHQATGVPSLAAEAVNFAPGRE